MILLHHRLLLPRVKIQHIVLLLHHRWILISRLAASLHGRIGVSLHKVALNFESYGLALLLNAVLADAAESGVFKSEEVVV